MTVLTIGDSRTDNGVLKLEHCAAGFDSMLLKMLGLGLLLLAVVFLALGVGVSTARSQLIYVDGDSCGYEVARALATMPGLWGYIARYWELDPALLREGVVLVVLYTNITPVEAFNKLQILKNNPGVITIVTDVALEHLGEVSQRRVINTTDLWMYCVYEDQEALNRIALVIKSNLPESTQGWFNTSPYVLIAGLAVLAASLSFNSEVRDFARKTGRRAYSTVLLLIAVLGLRIRGEKALEHPLRVEICRMLMQNGEMSFSEIKSKLNVGRGTLEWHLNLLVRAGVVEEIKRNRARFYRLLVKETNKNILK